MDNQAHLTKIEAFLLGASKGFPDKKLRAGLSHLHAWGKAFPQEAFDWINQLASLGLAMRTVSESNFAAICAGMAWQGIAPAKKWPFPAKLGSTWDVEFDDEGDFVDVIQATFDFDPETLASQAKALGPIAPDSLALLDAFYSTVEDDWRDHAAYDERGIESRRSRYEENLHLLLLSENSSYGLNGAASNPVLMHAATAAMSAKAAMETDIPAGEAAAGLAMRI